MCRVLVALGRMSVIQCINELNEVIDPLGLKISSIVSDDDDTIYYSLINVLSDDVAKVATNYKEKELIYFRKLVRLAVLQTTTTTTELQL